MKDFDFERIKISAANSEDMGSITAIYYHEVLKGISSWEEKPPDQDEMDQRRKKIQDGGYPYLTAYLGNKLIGYTYASPYRPRSGYRYTVESSIYISQNLRRRGLGQLLMANLIETCTNKGFRQMLAVIGDSNNIMSINFHLKLGFKKIATINSIGFKFERWLDSVVMQLPLGPGDKTPPN